MKWIKLLAVVHVCWAWYYIWIRVFGVTVWTLFWLVNNVRHEQCNHPLHCWEMIQRRKRKLRTAERLDRIFKQQSMFCLWIFCAVWHVLSCPRREKLSSFRKVWWLLLLLFSCFGRLEKYALMHFKLRITLEMCSAKKYCCIPMQKCNMFKSYKLKICHGNK